MSALVTLARYLTRIVLVAIQGTFPTEPAALLDYLPTNPVSYGVRRLN